MQRLLLLTTIATMAAAPLAAQARVLTGTPSRVVNVNGRQCVQRAGSDGRIHTFCTDKPADDRNVNARVVREREERLRQLELQRQAEARRRVALDRDLDRRRNRGDDDNDQGRHDNGLHKGWDHSRHGGKGKDAKAHDRKGRDDHWDRDRHDRD